MQAWLQVWWILLHGLFSQAVYPFPGPRVLTTPPPSSGMLVWWEADVGSNCGGACTDGASQSTWADQSGNGNNGGLAFNPSTTAACIASVYHTNLINSKPAVTFNGNTVGTGTATCFTVSGVFGGLDNKSASTFVMVSKARVTTPAITRAGGGTNSLVWNNNGAQQVLQQGSSAGIGSGISVVDTSWHQQIATYNSGTGAYAFYTDLVPDGSGTNIKTISSNWQAIGVTIAGGTIGTWDGDIAEFLLYSRVLTAGEISTVGTYLQTKYGLGHTAHWISSAVGDSGGASVNSQATAAQSVTTGNLLVAAIRGGNNSLTVSTVTDTAGNTFTQCPSARSNTSNMTDIWYAKNITGHASDVVTVNYSGGATFQGVIAMQFVGLSTTSPQDTSANGHATGTSVTSGSFTPAGAGEVAVVVASPSSGAAWTAGTGYGLQTNSGTSNVQTEIGYIGTGSQTASINIVGSNNLDLSVCVFK